jgi:hypothetical protein
MKDWANETWLQCLAEAWNEGKRMTDRELFERALSVLCNNVQPRDGVRDNRHLTPKSHVEIHQQTIDVLRGRLAQPEQEPVAKYSDIVSDGKLDPRNKFDAPPLRHWVGLTDEEIKEIIGPWGDTPIKGYTRKLFDQIEAKLKDKNK